MKVRNLSYGIGLAVAGAALFSVGANASPAVPDDGGVQANNTRQSPVPAAASSAPSSARLGTIVVTANKRSERLQDVPMAVTALSGYQLERESAVSFSDYVTQVPGLNTISNGEGQTQLILRGITSGGGQPNATVGTYLDGVPYGSSTVYSSGSVLTPDIDPADLQRIEVLRGPQGTLYGSNTLGGLVKFVTTPPDTHNAYGRVRAGYRSIDGGGSGFDVHAMVNLPLAQDKLGLRVNAYHRDDPGYIDNVATGQADVNQATVDGARAQLLWTPSDAVSLRLSTLAQNLSSDGLANGGVDVDPTTLQPLHGDLTHSRSPGTGLLKIKYRLYAATLNADFGWASLVSATSYSTLRVNQNPDVTAAFGAGLGAVLGVPNLGVSLRQPITLNKVTQELRLQSPEAQTLEWRVGVFYTHEHSTNQQHMLAFDATTGTPMALPTLAETHIGPAKFSEWAAYGDVTWHVTPRLSVLVGARYSHDRTTYAQSSSGLLVGVTDYTIEGSDSPVTFLFNPSYKFSDNVMGYVRVASGFRPGGPNVGVPPGLGAPLTFGPDKLVSYELGLKSTLLDQRMTLDVAAFYIDWSQIQLTVSKAGIAFQGNGGKATSQGVEVSWKYAPVQGLVISTNAAWTDATLAADTPPGLVGYDGDRLPYVPEWSTHLGVDYDFPLGGGWSGFVGGSYRYIGERKSNFTTIPVPRYDVPSYHGVDLRIGASHGKWILKAYVKNLTDERGITQLGSETTVATASPFAAAYVAPRTVGVSVSVGF